MYRMEELLSEGKGADEFADGFKPLAALQDCARPARSMASHLQSGSANCQAKLVQDLNLTD